MSLPTTASIAQQIDAPAELVYDLVADVTNMGRWSPECRSCEWIDDPGREGARFRGHNRSGMFRWTTEARVITADRGREFSFATLHKGEPATRWTYRFERSGQDHTQTTVTETFEAVRTPRLIAFAERHLIRDRQQQLEQGIRATLRALKAAAETPAGRDVSPDA
jgi:uncharacterized protein YndB with AHSA1/START domain